MGKVVVDPREGSGSPAARLPHYVYAKMRPEELKRLAPLNSESGWPDPPLSEGLDPPL